MISIIVLQLLNTAQSESEYHSLSTIKLPKNLETHITAIYADTIYLFGGQDDNELNALWWTMDISSWNLKLTTINDAVDLQSKPEGIWTEITPPSPPNYASNGIFWCSYECSVLIDHWLFIVSPLDHTNYMFKLDLSQNPPQFDTDFNAELLIASNASALSVATDETDLYYIAGSNLIKYHVLDDVHQLLTELPFPREEVTSAFNLDGTTLYIFGPVVDWYDVSTGIWTDNRDVTGNRYDIDEIYHHCEQYPFSNIIECVGGWSTNVYFWNTSRNVFDRKSNVGGFGKLGFAFVSYELKDYDAVLYMVFGGYDAEYEVPVDDILYVIRYANNVSFTSFLSSTTTSNVSDSEGFLFHFGDNLTWILLSIICLSIIMMVCGFINKKISGSDDFRYLAIILFAIYNWDMFSDCFFSVNLWNLYRENQTVVFLFLFIGSVVFIVLPMIKNFYDLIKYQQIWTHHPLHGVRYTSWLNQYGTILYILALVCGSTFGALYLVNSKLFKHRLFNMGLTQLHLREFNQKRLVNVNVMENIPQLFIQISYLFISKQMSTVAFLAIMSSVLSFAVSFLDYVTKQNIMKELVMQSLFSFVIFIENDDGDIMKHKYKTKKLGHEIAKIFKGLDKNGVEILPSQTIAHREYGEGLMLYLCISSISNHKELYNELKEAAVLQSNETISFLGKQILNGWNVEENVVLVIQDIQWINNDSQEEGTQETEGDLMVQMQTNVSKK